MGVRKLDHGSDIRVARQAWQDEKAGWYRGGGGMQQLRRGQRAVRRPATDPAAFGATAEKAALIGLAFRLCAVIAYSPLLTKTAGFTSWGGEREPHTSSMAAASESKRTSDQARVTRVSPSGRRDRGL
jgi:hypothetical protein